MNVFTAMIVAKGPRQEEGRSVRDSVTKITSSLNVLDL
jgi:hypothetical protein